jgi:hypothetical protein
MVHADATDRGGIKPPDGVIRIRARHADTNKFAPDAAIGSKIGRHDRQRPRRPGESAGNRVPAVIVSSPGRTACQTPSIRISASKCFSDW